MRATVVRDGVRAGVRARFRAGARAGVRAGWMEWLRSAANAYQQRRADLEPLARLLADMLAVAAVLHRRRAGAGRRACLTEGEPR